MRAGVRLVAVLLCSAIALSTAPATRAQSAEPSAFALWERLRDHYAGLPAYRDSGTITVAPGTAAEKRFSWSAAAGAAGSFRLTVTAIDLAPGHGGSNPTALTPPSDVVLWRENNRSSRYDAARGTYAPVASLASALDRLIGEGGLEALVGPALVALGPHALAEPDGLALDGSEPCTSAASAASPTDRAGSCLVLLGARDGGSVSFRYLVDPETLLLHRVEVDLPASPRPRRVVVELTPQPPSAVGALARVSFTPPAEARLASETPPTPNPTTASSASADGADPAVATGAAFAEAIDVTLSRLVVRVLDRRNEPLTGLTPSDFRVFIGRSEVPVSSAEWVASAAPLGADPPLEELAAAGVTLPAPGKLVVVFVQTDFEPSRLRGHVRMLPQARRFLDSLGIDDQIAVVSFDSHLKLHQDFTRNRGELEEALARAIRFSPVPRARRQPAPSLAAQLDPDSARKATSAERALELTARALVPLPGEKMVVYLGWGLGRFDGSAVNMTPDYDAARRALAAANAAVFVLDVSDSDYHSLEVGLQRVASDTGGSYAKTNHFAAAATDRLSRLVTGHYVVYFSVPPGIAPGSVRVELRDGLRGEVLTQAITHPGSRR